MSSRVVPAAVLRCLRVRWDLTFGLTFLPLVFSLVPLSLPLTITPPRRLQQLLEERERDEKEEVVEEVEDVRFVSFHPPLAVPSLSFHLFYVFSRFFLTRVGFASWFFSF